ncbi:hypothetical protein BLL42_25980 [Pseudomonas frederiksbergensis]|uniref:Uncharacterized protein n=1 Tax=Pseudomonas frederiksbergensis TaxID=104087 RepID=A0A1J0ESL3_9PSED|nr:hypothetical protein BLL42_25980 [Pseudomonas frederiksbergensis]
MLALQLYGLQKLIVAARPLVILWLGQRAAGGGEPTIQPSFAGSLAAASGISVAQVVEALRAASKAAVLLWRRLGSAANIIKLSSMSRGGWPASTAIHGVLCSLS